MKNQPRKPASKFAHLRKQMAKNQITKGLTMRPPYKQKPKNEKP